MYGSFLPIISKIEYTNFVCTYKDAFNRRQHQWGTHC